MKADRLLELYEKVAEAPGAIARLRRFVLDLAVRGKLVEQDPADEPASELLKRIEAEKARLVETGEIRNKPDLPNVDTSNQPSPVPSNWKWVRFGNIVDFSAGRTPARNDTSFWNTGDYPWVSIADMEDGQVVESTKETVSEKARIVAFKSEPEPAGTMIMSFKLTIGKIARLGVPAFHNEAIISIRPHLTDLAPYLFKVLPDLARGGDTKGAIKGATLNRESISNILIPLPPLVEQRRIVAKVEELMALLNRMEAARGQREATRDRLTAASLAGLTAPDTEASSGKVGTGFPSDDATNKKAADFSANARFALATLPALTTRPDQIKSLRQTILNLAVHGKLVDQEPSDEPASVGKHKLEDELPFDAPSGWQWVPFSAVAAFENGDRSKKYPKRTEYVASGVPWINTGHIEPDGTLSRNTMHFITEEKFASLGGGKIRPGDLVYCLRGATFGKTAFVEPYDRGAIASSLMIIRPGGQIERRYAFIYLTSPLGREQLRRYDNGTAQPNLSSASVKRYQVPLPPLAEQRRIVAKVDALMSLCDRLEAALAAADTTSARLLDALLHEAMEPANDAMEAAE